MRFSFLLAGMLAAFAAGSADLRAQTTNAPSGGSSASQDAQHRAIGFLPAADQDRLINAFNKAEADHPDFKTLEDKLRADSQTLENATPQDRQAFLEKLRMHQQKLRLAMLMEDPTIGPLLQKVDKHMSEVAAEHQKEMNSGGAPAAGGAAPATGGAANP